MSRLNVDDSGTYSCRAVNPYGSINASFVVQVLGRARKHFFFLRGKWNETRVSSLYSSILLLFHFPHFFRYLSCFARRALSCARSFCPASCRRLGDMFQFNYNASVRLLYLIYKLLTRTPPPSFVALTLPYLSFATFFPIL